MPTDTGKRPHTALREWRLKKKLTQHELANLVRCARSMIALIESGSRSPGLALAKRLALVTGLPLESF